ncbi:MAG: DUF4139 domain-containing protein [Candidatus Auribacterota bacterium]|jgi:hypothetical protein|nr:DUF4139 domain-containing protein [Candidatus Auribacterota bacterium]
MPGFFHKSGYILSVLFLCLSVSCGKVHSDQPKTATIDASSQSAVAVTIYNDNLGLVRDIRSVKLSPGLYTIQFMDVAEHILPTSVHAASLTAQDSFYVLEQNYEYDLINHEKLMDKYVGKDVKLVFKSSYDGSEEIRDAILLANNQQPVFKIGGEIHLGFPGRVILPELPEDLLARPTLVWLVDNKTGDSHDIEVSYLTSGISWECNYVMVLDKTDANADLTGWVSIDNRTGASFRNASVKLVAGEINRALPQTNYVAKRYMMETAAMPAPDQFEEKEFFEYHIYTLNRPATVKQNQMKQIVLFEGNDIATAKEYTLSGQRYYFTSLYTTPLKSLPVDVVVKFKNSKENNLGIPLPKGIIRVYKADHEGMLQFAGEDSIAHTPKDEEITVKLGEAFDIKAERKQTDYRKVRKDLQEVEWEIAIRNHKKENVTVIVKETVPGEWEIVDHTHPFKKESADTVSFSVPVETDGETVLRYRASIKW